MDPIAPAATLQLVPTFSLNSHGHALVMFDQLRELQYEGLILRNVSAAYQSGTRSYDLQKLKGWLDREFLIVDVVEKGKGKDAGKAKFVCVTGAGDPIEGVQFKVDIATSQENRATLWENRADIIGDWLTVRFAYYTQDGKPFHAQGQEIREEAEANQA
jgi:DNA ligase-1